MSKVISAKRVLLIGDSYGAARETLSNTVEQDETWPMLLAKNIYSLNLTCQSDFKPYRCLIECVNIIEEKDKHYDIIVIGAGIVDIFPRTLPYKLSRSQNIMLKIFRVFIRSIRQFWSKNIYWRPWYSIRDIDNAIMRTLPFCQRLILLTVPPLVKLHADENSGAQELMDQFNSLIKQKAEDNREQIYCADVSKLIQKKDIELSLDPKDSHYNKLGNKLVAQHINTIIKTIC